MTVKTKRSEFKSFLNIVPGGTASYKLLGDGIVNGVINYNPNITTEQYIHEDSASASVDSYAPSMPVEATYKKGDLALDYIETLRKARSVGTAAVTDVVNVWLFETATLGEYPAEKQSVAISFETFGEAGGVSNKISFTLNYIGDPVLGTFNPTTSTFTPNP